MWRKADQTSPQASPDSSRPVLASPEPPVAVAPSVPAKALASVSEGLKIQGEISGRGDMVYDGEFEGNIHIAEGSFTVGPHGHVNAEIQASAIIVHGEVVGSLKGGRVHVYSTGRVTGDMETRGIIIEDGAILHSKVKVRQEEAPARAAREEAGPLVKEAVAAAGGQRKEQET